MRTPAEEEPSLYVPVEFEADHLDDARRTVIRSRLRRSPPRALSRRLSGPWGRRTVAVAAHITAATLAMVLAAVTGTWAVLIAVLIGVSASLGISMLVFSWLDLKNPWGHAG